jgi:hypothetical protein
MKMVMGKAGPGAEGIPMWLKMVEKWSEVRLMRSTGDREATELWRPWVFFQATQLIRTEAQMNWEFISTSVSIYLPIYLPSYLPTYLPTYLTTLS